MQPTIEVKALRCARDGSRVVVGALSVASGPGRWTRRWTADSGPRPLLSVRTGEEPALGRMAKYALLAALS
jgi:hypothetical protein